MELLCTSVSWPGNVYSMVSPSQTYWVVMYMEIKVLRGLFRKSFKQVTLNLSCCGSPGRCHFNCDFLAWSYSDSDCQILDLSPAQLDIWLPVITNLSFRTGLLKKLQIRNPFNLVITAWLHLWALLTISHFSFLLLTSLQCAPTFSHPPWLLVAVLEVWKVSVLPQDRW